MKLLRVFSVVLALSAMVAASAYLVRSNGTGGVSKAEIMSAMGINNGTFQRLAKGGGLDFYLVRKATFEMPCVSNGSASEYDVKWYRRERIVDSPMLWRPGYDPKGNVWRIYITGYGDGKVAGKTACPEGMHHSTSVKAVLVETREESFTVNGFLLTRNDALPQP